MSVKVAMISLGCSKNLVDSERMLAVLEEAGMEIVADPRTADAAIVNTCAFIEAAQSEAIEEILELAELKKKGPLRAIVVAGCLSERYRGDVLEDIPEVDAVIGVGSWQKAAEAVKAALSEGPAYASFEDCALAPLGGRRILSTPPWTAYIKISEGCDNRCSYCVIPSIRGRYRSRPMEEIEEEARTLAAGGVKELIVVAQDTTRYGKDLYGSRELPALLERLVKIEGLSWIRLHYLYPHEVDDKLLDIIAAEPKILPYFDIPIQHVSDRILREMNRRGSRAQTEELIGKIRSRVPEAVIRTSLIVGLPGETEEEFEELCGFLRKAKLERAGVFTYSPEEGTPAAAMEGQIDDETKERRAETVSEIQSRIMDGWNEKRLGKKETVLVEGFDQVAECWYGRTYADSPDIDGKIFFTAGDRKPVPGEFVRIRITDIIDMDPIGEII